MITKNTTLHPSHNVQKDNNYRSKYQLYWTLAHNEQQSIMNPKIRSVYVGINKHTWYYQSLIFFPFIELVRINYLSKDNWNISSILLWHLRPEEFKFSMFKYINDRNYGLQVLVSKSSYINFQVDKLFIIRFLLFWYLPLKICLWFICSICSMNENLISTNPLQLSLTSNMFSHSCVISLLTEFQIETRELRIR